MGIAWQLHGRQCVNVSRIRFWSTAGKSRQNWKAFTGHYGLNIVERTLRPMSTEDGQLSFPPYGVMNQDETNSFGKILPIDWLPSPQDEGSTVFEKWNIWL